MADVSDKKVRLVVAVLGAVSVLAALALYFFVSPADTGDSPCGALADRTFAWEREGMCGITYTGAAAATVVLGVAGVALGVFAWLAPGSGRTVAWLLAVVTSGCIGAFLALAWTAAWYPEPVLQRGWDSARNLFLALSLLFGAMTVVVVAVRTTGSEWRGRIQRAARRPGR